MPRSRRCFWVVLGCILLAASSGRSQLQEVRIGVLAKRGAQRCMEIWSPTAHYLDRAVAGCHFTVVPLDYSQVYPAVARDQVDFIISNPSFYAQLETWYGVNRIATLKNRINGKTVTVYGGVIFCRADRKDIGVLSDLAGKAFMAADEKSLGGWLAAWREFKEKGIDPYKDFAKLGFAGTHDNVVYKVRERVVDAGTVRTDTLERMSAEGLIRLQDFRVLHPSPGEEHLPFLCSTRLYPEWSCAKTRKTSDELAEAVATALIRMPADSEAARASNAAGWTIPLNYEPVHELLRELKLGPYKNLGKITLRDVVRIYWPWFLAAAMVFVVMAGGVVAIFHLNRHLNVTDRQLRAEIEERKQVEQDLIHAKEQAEAATQAKSDFLANMSHEIRTPMNGVIAAADLALNEKLPPKVEHFLKIIYSSGHSLLGIINDILDFSKIEADKLDLDIRRFQIDEVLDRLDDLFASRIAEKQLEFMFDLDPETPRVLVGDPLRLQQVLKNLVDNAVKFTDRGGVILAGIRLAKRFADHVRLQFYVKDTGVGIPPESLPRLFQPFCQVDTSSTRKYEGTGLGLCICKQLVEMMGGEISVESEPGQGTTFFFSVAFGVDDADQQRRSVLPEDLAQTQVMVVDDCEATRRILKTMLATAGFRVVTSDSGAAALSAVTQAFSGDSPIGLVVLDADMPDMDGMETARRIRAQMGHGLPILLMTAFGRQPDQTQAEAAGISGVLIKPISQSALLNLIMDAFGKGEARIDRQRRAVATRASVYRQRLAGVRVLVAEDNPTNQEIALAILENAGISAVIANTGKAAVEAVQREPFDAVLMDIQMPQMDGFEATRQIRRTPQVATIPIIAMTAHAMKGDEQKCLAAGMDGYVSKPINQERLFATLWRLVKLPAQPFVEPEMDQPAEATINVTQGHFEPLPDAVPGLQIAHALEALAIDPADYRRILSRFLSTSRESAAAIEAAGNAQDWEAVGRLAHGLKGSAANIGAETLAGAAADLEAGARRPPVPKELVDRVEAALSEVLGSLETLLKPSDQPEPAPPVAISPKDLDQKLARLAQALEAADPERIAPLLSEVGPHLEAALADEITRHIDAYDYDQALALLRSRAETPF
jgi:two-component system sensor histidine kinase/response regulator